MNELDYLILLLVGLSALLGLIRGVVAEVLSLLVWVVAIWGTVAFGGPMGGALDGIDTPLLRSLAGHASVFVIIVVVGNLLVWMVRAVLRGTGLSGTDRMLGFGFGTARGYAIVLAGVLLVSFTPWSRSGLWRESALLPLFFGPTEWIASQLPESSDLLAFARPVLDAVPGQAASAVAIDPAQAAQWAGLLAKDPGALFGRPASAPPGTDAAAPALGGDPALIGGGRPTDSVDVRNSRQAPADPARLQPAPEPR